MTQALLFEDGDPTSIIKQVRGTSIKSDKRAVRQTFIIEGKGSSKTATDQFNPSLDIIH